MTSCKWKDGTPLPSTVSATYKGLLKACTEEGVPLGALFTHPDVPANEHDVTWYKERIAAMVKTHNTQVQMISQLTAERNKLQQQLAVLEEHINCAPDIDVLLYHPESDSLFRATRLQEYWQGLDAGCDDVTGNPTFEKTYAMQQAEPNWLGIALPDIVRDEDEM